MEESMLLPIVRRLNAMRCDTSGKRQRRMFEQFGIPVCEYEPTKVKKAVVGVGRAEKSQVETMVKILLPGCKPKNNDSSDALAMAICHNSYRTAR